ncbi:cytochrome P450 76C1-like [Papaver somniferum]|uniref:cytochrome P450 76C1-like n=1 Tax=Papaver somniferum TaxID=3469 RepID=UPI000E6F5B55|nr:cytochrome P450 76C1-like [Papaver somniferum]
MFLIMLNVVMNMMWGGTFNDEDKTRIDLEFRKRAEEVLDYLGRTNISDFLPVLARFDLQGVEQGMKKQISWLDPFFESMIDKRMELDQEMKLNGDQDGRRRCIGIPLVERIILYALASLLHSFEWRMPEGVEVDLSEKFGIVLKTGTPLTAIPVPRLSDSNLYALC